MDDITSSSEIELLLSSIKESEELYEMQDMNIYSFQRSSIHSRHSVNAAILLMKEMIELYANFSDSSYLIEMSEIDLMSKIELCIKRFSKGNLEKLAKESADDIEIPIYLLDEAKEKLKEFGSLEALAKSDQILNESKGFNLTRIQEAFQKCSAEARDRCSDIAINGVSIPTTNTFISLQNPAPMRKLGKSLGKYFLKSALEDVKAN